MERMLGLVVVVLLGAMSGMAQTVNVPARWTATVNGESITDEQVRRAAANEIDKIEKKRAQVDLGFQRDEAAAYRRTLELLIETKVIQLEAEMRSVTPESLLATEVESKVVVPSNEEARAYWDVNKTNGQIFTDHALDESRATILRQRRSAAYLVYMETLRERYKVETSVDPVRTKIATEGFPSMGPTDARVTIVEFADFECPYCSALFKTLKETKAHYGDKLQIVFRQFPLTTLHVHAEKAAEASLCAFEQGKFWEMHDAMFLDNRALALPSQRP